MPASEEKAILQENKKVRTHLIRDHFVAVDVETTGLLPQRGDRVIEVGAVASDGRTVLEEFHSLINTSKRISFLAQQIHGITHDMLVDEPASEAVFPQFREFIKNKILIAHNAEFDIKFLRYELGRLGLALTNEYFCTLKLSRILYPQLQNYRLETVYRHFFKGSSAGKQRHRALDDARMVAKVWMEMMKK
jgi:DNA polymerase III epsilon subunit